MSAPFGAAGEKKIKLIFGFVFKLCAFAPLREIFF
jgi:hypothetical protein